MDRRLARCRPDGCSLRIVVAGGQRRGRPVLSLGNPPHSRRANLFSGECPERPSYLLLQQRNRAHCRVTAVVAARGNAMLGGAGLATKASILPPHESAMPLFAAPPRQAGA